MKRLIYLITALVVCLCTVGCHVLNAPDRPRAVLGFDSVKDTDPLSEKVNPTKETTAPDEEEDTTAEEETDSPDDVTDETEETTTDVTEETTAPEPEETTAPEPEETTAPAAENGKLSAEVTAFGSFGATNITDENAKNALQALNTYLDGIDASVVYYSFDTGAQFSFRADDTYHCQSTIKAPYALAVMKDLGSMEACDETTVTLEAKHIVGGMGQIKDLPLGTDVSVSELIRQAIRNSDNTAYVMLYDRFGSDAFNQIAQELGCTCRLQGDRFCDCSAEDMAILFRWIWEDGSDFAKTVLEHLENTNTNFLINYALPGKRIAHKYGLSTNMKDCHDCAIVYGEHPYLLIIYSKYEPSDENPYGPFRRAALLCDNVHEAFYSTSD